MNDKARSVDVLGTRIDRVTTIQVLDRIKRAIEQNDRLVISTPNSEFLLRGLEDSGFLALVNSSDINVADGSGVQWAANFLERPRRPILASWIQALAEGFNTLSPTRASAVIPERIPGSLLVWDIASLASKNGYRLFLLGGIGGVAEETGRRLKEQYPNLVIAGSAEGARSGDEKDQVTQISESKADIALVAFGSPFQEEWIAKTERQLPHGVFVGVGGTFDFIAGGVSRDGGRLGQYFPARQTPRLVQTLGLGFLWRLITQPWRARRIWRAAPFFMYKVVQYKEANK